MTYGERGGGLEFNGDTKEDLIDFEDTLAITFHSYTSRYNLWLKGEIPTYIRVSSLKFAQDKCDIK